MTVREHPATEHVLQCMEIWGGTSAVQQAFRTPGLDAWVYSRPFQGAADGGDVHYVSLCGGGVITRLIVADVSGHGAAVADLASALRLLMRRNINAKSQTRLVQALNRQFAELAESSRFATAVVATYLATSDRLTICNAGHPRPLWYDAHSRAWHILSPESVGACAESANLPLGLDESAPYDQFFVNLGSGDVVVLYTDAFTEAVDTTGRVLGEQGLLELARELDPADPTRLGRELTTALDRFRGGRPPEDDVTLLALHHNGSPPKRLSLGEKFDVYAKVFGLKSV
jgi:serine phosphatase RsbU (regulator of sigma subunit)